MEGGRNLATAGAWNFLWRLGIHAARCRIDELPTPSGAVLFASLERELEPRQASGLRSWIGGGGYLVASGVADHWAGALGWDRDHWRTCRPENPYAALAWRLPVGVPELVTPPLWPYSVCLSPPAGVRVVGDVLAVQGERQTPDRATLAALGAPAMALGEGFCYLNGHPFAALQAWLQGQSDLQPWLAWRHRLFWLDEWVAWLAGVLSEVGALSPTLPRPGIAGLAATTVVLRHDLDHSRDVSYLQAEQQRGWPATHGILRDGNTDFWRRTLATQPAHETALHYNTGRREWLRDGVSRWRGRGATPMAVSHRAVSGRGLSRQVQWAKDHGIGVASLLRHLSFQPYPEWVDALDHAFATHPEVAGGSSMFRAQVLRWGADRVDGVFGTVGEWPDPQTPFWLPFKLAHAADGGRLLRGWESTSVMESEPEMVDQLLSHRLTGLPQRVLTLGYHPAHAAGTTFHQAGSLPAFERVLDVLHSHGVDIKTSRDVFRLGHVAESSVVV